VDPASFGVKVVPSLNGADPSFMNSVTGSVCRAKCSNILQDIILSVVRQRVVMLSVFMMRDIRLECL
jgi:hypothetical protein